MGNEITDMINKDKIMILIDSNNNVAIKQSKELSVFILFKMFTIPFNLPQEKKLLINSSQLLTN